MHVAVENLNNLERKMTVSIPFEVIDQKIDQRLKELTKTAKIDGFRPGKVPEKVIKQRFGQSIEMEILEEVIDQGIKNAFQEKNLNPATFPHVHADSLYESGKPFTFTATFEVFPEVVIKPFEELIIEKTFADIKDEDIEKTLQGMQKQHTVWTEIDRPAQQDDKVWIKFEGTIDGTAFEGGKHDNMSVIIGSRSTIPGFEEGITGARKNEEREIAVNFPDNYGAKDLAGKAAKFVVHVNKIELPALPELNDEFAAKFGIDAQEGGYAKLREEVKSTLEKQIKRSLHQKLKAEVMTKLYDAYKHLEIPNALVKQEASNLLEQTKKQFAQYQSKAQSETMPSFSAEMFEERAKERVVLGMIVRKIIADYHLQADPKKVRELIEAYTEQFDEPEKAFNYYYNNEKRLQEMQVLALEEQVVEKILAQATLVEKAAKPAELLSMPESIGE